MKKNLIASVARITQPYFSSILTGKKRPTWDLAKRLGQITLSDPRFWANGDTGEIGRSLERMVFISDCARMAEITPEMVLSFLMDHTTLSDSQRMALAQATHTTPAQWIDPNINPLIDAIDEWRQELENQQRLCRIRGRSY